MATTDLKTVDELLALAGVEVEPHDYGFDYDGNGGVRLSEDHPGVALTIGSGAYYFYAGDIEVSDTPVTYRQLREAGLLDLLEPGYEWDEERKVEKDDLRPDLLERLSQLAVDQGREADLELSEFYAQVVMEDYEGAKHFICYSPRGFGNEVELYAVRKGELAKAKKWVGGLCGDSVNADWSVLTPTKVRNTLCDSYWHHIQPDTAHRQMVTTLSIKGWWSDTKAAKEERNEMADAAAEEN